MGSAAATPNFNYGFPTPGPQHPTGDKVMDHVFFLSNTGWKRIREYEQFDYIVIGSGICGYAFAERVLRTQPRARVLIIEQGPFFLDEHFQNLAVPYQQTLGGLSETFPWTLSARTAEQPAGNIRFQHGMVPFVGGRSIMWSTWCPRPRDDELKHWPQQTIDAAHKYFESAEKLLNVVPADKIDQGLTDDDGVMRQAARFIPSGRPVYGVMQRALQEMLSENLGKVSTATRSMAAPMAVGAGVQYGLDFAKFSVPPVLLELIGRQAARAKRDEGSALRMVTNCVVNRVDQQNNVAKALDTSRGVVNIAKAKLILAMGSLPPTTLVLNSFPKVKNVGERFTAHFITAIVARIPLKDYDFARKLYELELAAIYMAGVAPSGMQYHVQLSVLSDTAPEKHSSLAARYMPDVVATASPAQLAGSGDYLVFVCAVLGELDFVNANNFLKRNCDLDPTTNVTLQAIANSTDKATWDTMDNGTFDMLEQALSPKGRSAVQYWHGSADAGEWLRGERPPVVQRRVPGLVHEGSTLWIGDDDQSPTDLDYRLHDVDNVYVTGGGLWPAGGSWNPTMMMVALTQDLADRLTASGS